MSRKRKSDPSTPTETPAATEPPIAESATAVAEPPAEPMPEASFADRVGQKHCRPRPIRSASPPTTLAGVRLFESKQDRQMAIKFGEGRPEDKPSQAVIDKMKEAGFRWNPADRYGRIRSGRTPP